MKCILVVDDSTTNLKFVESVLKGHYKLTLVKSGEKALKYLAKNSVDLILLDILMPEMDGFQTYEKIRQQELNRDVPVIFLTANMDEDNEIKGLAMGAVDFIRKPFAPDVMLNRIHHILQYEELNKNLESKVREKTAQIEQLSFEIISTIASMIEAKDSYTKGHSIRVAEYCVVLAKALGWKEEDIQNLKYIALLHDIGKVGIPDSVLNKPGKLTDEEFSLIKSHTTLGGEILKDIKTIVNVDAGAKFHHERYDGKGYPCGLVGEHIPVVARIISIADAYDAMKSKRVYRDSLPLTIIRKELVNGRGTQFDPNYVDIFIRLFDEGKLDIELSNIEKSNSGEGSALVNQIVKCIEEEAKKAENCDYLTGLLGRKEGENQIVHAMKEKPGCLAFLDLDNLKRTNDTMGHLAGDFALKTVGEVLSEYGEDAVVTRMGGDEFLYYMIDVDKEKAKERIGEVILAFQKRKEQNIYLSASSLSIGLCMTTPKDSYEDIFRKSDRALYHVKQSGKSGFFFYNSSENSEDKYNSIDLQRLVCSLKQQGAYSGPLNLEYREFAKIYELFQHIGDRYQYNIHLMMITLDFESRDGFYIDEREHAMTYMDKSIRASLRTVDVSTRFSSDQFIVILMNARNDAVSIITDRILDNFYKVYDRKMVSVHFHVAEWQDESETKEVSFQ